MASSDNAPDSNLTTEGSSNTTDWDVHGLYENFKSTYAVDNSTARDLTATTYRLTDLVIDNGPNRAGRINDTANEIIQTNQTEHQPSSALSVTERTALDLQRFVRQQLRQGTSPQELEQSLKNLQCGWQVTLQDGTFNITRPGEPGAGVHARVNVADVPTGDRETPQQAAARLAERFDVLKNNPALMRAYMDGVTQFIARAQMAAGGHDFAGQFAEAFRARLPEGFQFGYQGNQVHLARGRDGEEIFRGTMPDAGKLRERREEFRVAQSTLNDSMPPGTGARLLASMRDLNSSERQVIESRMNVLFPNSDLPFEVKLRRMHGLPDNASESVLTGQIEANVRQNMRAALTEMRTFVNDHVRQHGGTQLSDTASAQEVIKALEAIRGPFVTQPPGIGRFDLSRHAFFYSFPRTGGGPDLPDGRTNPNSYYCHNFTFDKYGTSPNVIDELERGGFQLVEQGTAQVGDLIFYSREPFDSRRDLLEPGHSGRVVAVNPDGSIIVASKLNYGPLAMHHILDPSLLRTYGPHVSVYRARR